MTGEGAGLRQPVHAEDIADFCLHCVRNGFGATQTYILAGGETLSYRNIIERLFIDAGLKPRIITIPCNKGHTKRSRVAKRPIIKPPITVGYKGGKLRTHSACWTETATAR